MKKIELNTICKRMLADVYTPVGIYLRLRDKFRDTILLESTDHQATENSWSFICVNAIGGIEIASTDKAEFKLPGKVPEKIEMKRETRITDLVWNFLQQLDIIKGSCSEERFAQGLYGYTAYDAIPFFESLPFKKT